MIQDLRQAVRLFRSSPGFAAAVALTLALGIGLTSSMFSIVDGVLLKPLPYSSPSELVTARNVAFQALTEWRARTSALSDLAFYDFSRAPLLLTGEDAARMRQVAVSANLLSVLGVQPAIGRGFRPADAAAGAEPVVMLTHGVWLERFGARANVIGELAPFEPLPLRIVGVLPADFIFPMRRNTTVGDARILTVLADSQRADFTFGVVARLKNGASVQQAHVEGQTIARGLAEGSRTIETTSLTTAIVGGHRFSLLLLFGAVGFLLFIACANIANLMLARSLDARRDLAVRRALGARRYEIVRLAVAQSAILCLTGGLLGILFAYWSFDAFLALVSAPLPRGETLGVGARTIGFALLVSMANGLVLGAVPGWYFSRGSHLDLDAGGRATTPAQRLRLVVLSLQVALAVVLLSAAGLAANSFVRLLRVDLGFSPDRVLSLRMRGPESRYPTREHQRELLNQALERLAALPGVTSVGAVEQLPVTRAVRGASVVALAAPTMTPSDAEPRVVTLDYFKTLGIDIVRGRAFDRTDRPGAVPVAIVNEALARRLWGMSEPLGRQLRADRDEPRTVVGVVRDLRTFAVDTAPEPQLYIPHSQSWLVPPQIVIRTDGSPEVLARFVRQELRALEPHASIENVGLLSAHVASSISQPRFQTWLLGIFGGSGLLLVALGIASLVSYGVSSRAREVAIRIALGARPADIVRTVVGSSFVAVAIGLVAGLAAALAAGRLVKSYLYQITPQDPSTLAAVVGMLGLTALLAAWVPARRALRVDPVVALRVE